MSILYFSKKKIEADSEKWQSYKKKHQTEQFKAELKKVYQPYVTFALKFVVDIAEEVVTSMPNLFQLLCVILCFRKHCC